MMCGSLRSDAFSYAPMTQEHLDESLRGEDEPALQEYEDELLDRKSVV